MGSEGAAGVGVHTGNSPSYSQKSPPLVKPRNDLLGYRINNAY